MIRKAIHTAVLAAVLATAAACLRDEEFEPQTGPDSGFVKIEFRADIPAPEIQSVGTRAVDPDGGGVRDMTLFCFDNFGLFITTVTADVSPDSNTTDKISGTFTAENVPYHTRRIHFVANQNMTDFTEQAFINKSETDVLALLEGSAGHMIYWARFACSSDASKDIAKQITEQGGVIKMLRNHALVAVGNPTGNGAIEITGMAACNIQAFGTVAPYDPEKGFEFTIDEWRAKRYVTIPQRDAKQSDIMDVTARTSQYIFEHENTSDDPVSIILRGHLPGQTANDDLYYRVMLYDDETGDFIPVRRNHRYTLHINGPLSFGQPSFEKALTAPATNNVWVSISDDVNEVEDNNYILRVDKTFIVYDEKEIENKKSISLGYSLKAKDAGVTLTQADKPTVTWIDNSVATQSINNIFTPTGDEAVGTIIIVPRALGSNERLEGTLLVKHGRLQRKIKIIVIKRQTFVPSWISTGLYGGANAGDVASNRSHVTLMFSIPESCPEELFPMNVYITADELDIRNASGMTLPVVRNGDTEWHPSQEYLTEHPNYDGPSNADYKFVLTAQKPGQHRIYFENILYQQPGASGTVYIESPHFETMSRTYNFSNIQPNNRKAISVENVGAYISTDLNLTAGDIPVSYFRVPQKAGALVLLNMRLYKVTGSQGSLVETNINAEGKDEFLFYTKNLNNYREGEYSPDFKPDCYFAPYADMAADWSEVNNKGGGRMLMFKPREDFTPATTGMYNLYLYTNRAQSAEPLRISSNINDLPAVYPDDNGTDGLYAGGDYRSFVLELTNYTPFCFGARVRYNDGEWMGSEPAGRRNPDGTPNPRANVPEDVTDLVWTFEPNRKVDIAIDVTSFAGLANTKGDDTQADRVSVDPFGRAFEIYIDAPMLEIDKDRLAACRLNAAKLKADPAVPGRFIYTVEATRDAERAFGSGDPVVNADPAPDAASQTGERKVLPFIVKDIASAGDIVISSNKEQVVFYDKTFRVTNESIKGNIVYEMKNADNTITQVPVPDDLFVAFERVTNSNRIGSVTMTGDGRFELRLRKEYPLNWTSYPVAFHFEHEGHIHHAEYPSLDAMYAAIQNGETVVLKREEPQNPTPAGTSK